MPVISAVPVNEQGRFYHLDCGPGDIAPYILTCGDPARARRLARHFETVEIRRRNREFVTITGRYRGIPITALATGIGPDNTAIAVIEASQAVSAATFIRLGTTGALQEHIALGDLIITEQAVRDENTTHYYAPPDFQALAHPAVLDALKKAAKELGVPYHLGVTCTTSDFYAGQGRTAPGFTCRDPGKVERLRAAGVLNFEMEMSAYLTLARISSLPLRAGGACVVLDNLVTRSETFSSRREKSKAITRLLRVGLRAVEILYASDQKI
ncbi:MAG: nucleoside phosphorylase [Deltaproteobacteria bacterium]|nr:nucleoside phosphorylase [Deltaproteobacteria bacterium]